MTACPNCKEFEQQIAAFQTETTAIIAHLEKQLKMEKQKSSALEDDLEILKRNSKTEINSLRKEIDLLAKLTQEMREREDSNRLNVVQLENLNESLQNQLRAANSMLSQYKDKVQQTMEELANAQIQLQITKQTSQQKTARLKSKLKEAEDDLLALNVKHQKHNDEKQKRRATISSTSLTGAFFRKSVTWKLRDSSFSASTSDGSNKSNLKEGDDDQKMLASFDQTMAIVRDLLLSMEKRAKQVWHGQSTV